MFTDVSGLIARNPPAQHYGVAAADVDGDGQTEFVVAGFGGPNRVLKWAGGRLVDIAPPLIADPERQAVAVAAGDVDGDGREELYVLNTDTFAGAKQHPDRLFDARPDGTWVDLFSLHGNRPALNRSAGRSVAAIDRRGTGRYGFFVASYAAQLKLIELGPDGRLADRAAALGLDLAAAGRGLWVGPIASDRPDVFCVTDQGPNFLFKNRGDGTFDEVAAVLGLADADEHARGVTVLDADGDGRLDLCWANWHGTHRLMVRQIDGTFRDAATPAMALPGAVRTVIAADFDNDGFEELFFNCLGEPNRLFRASGGREPPGANLKGVGVDPGGKASSVSGSHPGAHAPRSPWDWRLDDPGPAMEPEGLGTGAAIADIDGDGVLELLIAHGESAPQPLSLFKVPTANAWLRVKPLTRFGAPARGAIVKLRAGGRTQVRVIDGGSGYLCQMEPVAHFGLGGLTAVESITVVWPDGATWVGSNPPMPAVLDIPYPTT